MTDEKSAKKAPLIESVQRIEPALLDDLPVAIADAIAELSAASATLARSLHPRTAANLAGLVRIMNTYYSNLIEGHDTRPRDIERALATLVEDQRNALLLVVLEGLSYREVAEVQGVPIGTVMSRLARARVQIKSYLDGERPTLRRVK